MWCRNIFIVTMVALAMPAAWAQTPRLVVDQPVYDFGESDNSQVIEHTFTLRNEGDATLHITQTRSSCGCTVAQLSAQEIEPGQSATLTGRFNLAGRSGRQQSVITVTTDDPQNPSQQLSMQGDVSQPVTIRPARIFFGQLSSQQDAERTVDITSRPGEELDIQSIDPLPPHLEAEWVTSEPGRSHTITVRTQPPLPAGLLQATLRVHTTHPRRPVIEVPIIAQVIGALAVAPERITLLADSATPVTRYIVVRPGDVTDFEIQEVITPDPRIGVQILHVPNTGYRIQLNHIVASKELDGQVIRIKTNVPGYEEISVPFQLIQ